MACARLISRVCVPFWPAHNRITTVAHAACSTRDSLDRNRLAFPSRRSRRFWRFPDFPVPFGELRATIRATAFHPSSGATSSKIPLSAALRAWSRIVAYRLHRDKIMAGTGGNVRSNGWPERLPEQAAVCLGRPSNAGAGRNRGAASVAQSRRPSAGARGEPCQAAISRLLDGTARSLRLAAQDVALSRRKQGFESPRERQ
jgi:hypothetical protein